MLKFTNTNGYVIVRSDDDKLIKFGDEVHSEYYVNANEFTKEEDYVEVENDE